MPKKILYGMEARSKIQAGVNKVADAVNTTLGSKGRNVMFAGASIFMPPTITNDGVTIAKQIDLKDKFENMGAQYMKDVAQKTNDTSGDGTTTATILAQAIVNEGLKNVAAGANPMELKKGIDKAVSKVVDNLRAMAKPVSGREDIEKVATISGNNDPEIGKIIADIFQDIGKDGVISVEETGAVGLQKEIVKGLNFPKGILSPYMITDNQKMECALDNPDIFVTDKKITMAEEMVLILNTVLNAGKKQLLIVAEDVSNDAMTVAVTNKIKGIIDVAAIQAPGFGENKKDMLLDIAAVTGATVVSSDFGISLTDTKIEYFGSARRVVSDRGQTTIIDGKGKKDMIKMREDQINGLLAQSKDSNQRVYLTDRLAKITGGIGIIKVGATTEAEMRERKFRIEDAVEATNSAIEEGIVAGGGVALLNCGFPTWVCDTQDESVGLDIINRAIKYPIKQIAANAGANGEVVINEIKTANPKYKTIGWNCKTGKYGDMLEMGIVDPVKVTRCALENAASIAGMILTTDVVIAEDEEQ